jgi:predicted PurR-regulated permease PerM
MQPSTTPMSRNVIETALILLCFFILIYALYDVLRIFFGVFTFAIIFSVPFARGFEKQVLRMKGRRKLAAFLHAFFLILIFALPFSFMVSAAVHHVRDLIHWIADAQDHGLPPLPSNITGLPLVGEEIAVYWRELQAHPKQTLTIYGPQIRVLLHNLIHGAAGMLGIMFEIVVGIIISSFLLLHGKTIHETLRHTIKHLLGSSFVDSLPDVSVKAINGVAIGVMGTGFVAALLSLIGLLIAHIPFAIGLSLLIFILVLIQVGPLLVWVPVVIWTFMSGHMGMGIFLSVYGVILLAIDAVLKPVLIARSGRLPFLVLFLGVIGGLAAWGFTGMFKGAIILAIVYSVFNIWLKQRNASEREIARG